MPFTVSSTLRGTTTGLCFMGIPKGPKMGRKVSKWAESLLVPCWASPILDYSQLGPEFQRGPEHIYIYILNIPSASQLALIG